MAVSYIYVDDVMVDEGDVSVTFTVYLDQPATAAVSVKYSYTDLSASRYTDYTSGTGTLSFTVGESSKTVTFALDNDLTVENLEAFLFTLNTPTNAIITKNTAYATIVDNDDTSGTPNLIVDDVVVDESGAHATFTVRMDKASNSSVSVDFATQDVSAKGGASAGVNDYLTTAGSLTFAAGETVKTVQVAINNDTVSEGDERFNLLLSNASGATLSDAVGTALIGRSDGTATAAPYVSVDDIMIHEGSPYAEFTVKLSQPGTQKVTLNFSYFDLNADHYTDYAPYNGALVFAPGETVKTVKFALDNDTTAESIESMVFTLAVPTGGNAVLEKGFALATIVDDDKLPDPGYEPNLMIDDVVVDESGTHASFTVRMDKASNSNVSVDYTTQNVSATGGATAGLNDYLTTSGSLTFAAGETVKTVQVEINNDTVAEGAERFNLLLSNASGAILTDAVGTALIGRSDGTAAASPYASVEDVMVGENSPYVEFVVKLSQPGTQKVTLNFSYFDLNADHYYDYSAFNGSLVFAPGETVKTVRFGIDNDTAIESIESMVFTLAVPTGGNAILDKGFAFATLIDNDKLPDPGYEPNLMVDDVVVDETGTHASFTVRMDQSSNSNVSVDFATQNVSATGGATAGLNDYLTTAGSLTFAAGETVKTVQVEINNDAVSEGDERFNLLLSNASGATLTDAVATALIGRNDTAMAATPYVSVDDIVVDESSPYLEFVVKLSQPGTQKVTLNFTYYDHTADHHYDYAAFNGSLVFAPGETVKTVRFDIDHDTAIESIESMVFSLSLPTGGNAILDKGFAFASIVDNDKLADPGYEPNLMVDDVVVDETGTHASFTVRMDKASNSNVSVDFATQNVSATGGASAGLNDYLTTSGNLTFAAGETVKTVQVEINNDSTAEADERFNLVLSNAAGATLTDAVGTALIGRNDATAIATPYVTIDDIMIDEDSAFAEFTVRLSQPCTQKVTLNYDNSNISASHYDDYVNYNSTSLIFAPGETVKTIKFALQNDTTAEDIQAFLLTLSVPAGGNAVLERDKIYASIVDNDSLPDPGNEPHILIDDVIVDETAGLATFTVRMDQASNSNVSVDFSTQNQTAIGSTTPGSGDFLKSSGTLTFAAGETVKSVQVEINNDTATESDERFNLVLSNASGASLTDDAVGTALIGHNDQAGVALPNIYLEDAVAIEGDAAFIELKVWLDKPGTSPVKASYVYANLTAQAGYGTTDYGPYNGTLIFAPGETVKTVKFDVHDDLTAELALEGFAFAFSSVLGATTIGNAAVGAIADDDGTSHPMAYGMSNDTYIVGSMDDLVLEAPSGGIDLVKSSITYTLAANVEKLQLTGADVINGTGNELNNTLTGNGAKNTLSGEAGNDTLVGGAGADLLDGGTGSDSMSGGTGNDTYIVDQTTDKVVELANAGTDLVKSSVNRVLGNNQENLTLIGTDNINGTGNGLKNILLGNTGNNILNGKAGADSMNGSLGDDTYIVDNVGDKVTETSVNGGTDLVKSSVTFALGNNLENLTLTGAGNINGNGNTLKNIIVANTGNNVLNGGGNIDTLSYVGTTGAVTVSLANTLAQITGGSGTDTLSNFENLTGGTGNDHLTGTNAANTLDGGLGIDTLVGGAGNDTYLVNASGDVVDETDGLGHDAGGVDSVFSSVNYTLSVFLENLMLTGTGNINGTGNASNNIIVANNGNNVLKGNAGNDTVSFVSATAPVTVDLSLTTQQATGGSGLDTLTGFENIIGGQGNDTLTGTSGANVMDGYTGADSLDGAAGNDTYIVDNVGDKAIEGAGLGIDTVKASVSVNMFTNFVNVEKGILTGTAHNNITGNSLNNTLTGNAGNNTLDGYSGNDTLTGLAGNDSLVGGSGKDKLLGGDGNDTLVGGYDNDTLTGGNGQDVFRFGDVPVSGNTDVITDFSISADQIQLDNAWLYSLTTTAGNILSATEFWIGSSAHDSTDRIIYNSSTGALYYDYDGNSAGLAVKVADLSAGLALTNNHFSVI